jgi:hypothetical protein
MNEQSTSLWSAIGDAAKIVASSSTNAIDEIESTLRELARFS